MDHLHQIRSSKGNEELLVKLTGKYYTHEFVAKNAIRKMIEVIKEQNFFKANYRICDPFCGDGRLIFWFLEEWSNLDLPKVNWSIELWDIDKNGLNAAKLAVEKLKKDWSISEINVVNHDSFKLGIEGVNKCDIVITNPPWEMIKPDSRELKGMSDLDQEIYISNLRVYDSFLSKNYPLSQPQRKFAGWGTNLSRVGIELTRNILDANGLAMIVVPASFLADDQSSKLRTDMFTKDLVYDISYYPAEARLFGKADINSATIVFQKGGTTQEFIILSKYDLKLDLKAIDKVNLANEILVNSGFSLPMNTSTTALDLMEKLGRQNKDWGLMEEDSSEGLWAGREIDETGNKKWLIPQNGKPWFIKGRMIDRFCVRVSDFQSISKKNWKQPKSINHEKIVWRDVSRSNQKRRIIATIIPKGFAAGNSLGVCYFKDSHSDDLKILLGIMNSLCFEFQLRNFLATGHISLSSLRKTKIPSRRNYKNYKRLLTLVKNILDGNKVESRIEAYVAKVVFGLGRDEFNFMITSFEKILDEEKQELLKEYDKVKVGRKEIRVDEVNIFNHLSSSLSALDMAIVHAVPPGGNWKNIPEEIPSKRVRTIRESYAEGKGSRSTYYGRLLPNKPSYTINTYLNRPGNGCHIHYSQDRVISQREAARLQSFPDSFEFIGSQQSVNTQIGNAVPPLLAFQVAEQINQVIGSNGVYIDLFSGAGGMGLGFKWAGWESLYANDIEKRFLETYSRNVHANTILGSISESSVFDELIETALMEKEKNRDRPFWILGGPPCQGFSTAGKKRTMDDPRNLLFRDYTKFLKLVKPDGFVFENVSGLLNMEKGRVYESVKNEFQKVMDSVEGFVLQSEHYAIPQRRKRVFLIGQNQFKGSIKPPQVITKLEDGKDLFENFKKCVSVSDALSDLPTLEPGQNGDNLDYISTPLSDYQRLMRGAISPIEYLSEYRDF